MKQIAFLILVLTLFACKKEVQKEFLISSISNLKEKEVYLAYGMGSSNRIDTIKVVNGRFVINAAPENAETMQLFFPKCNQSILFFGNGQSRLKISGNLSEPITLKVSGDSINNLLNIFKDSILEERKALETANHQADRAWQKDSIKRYSDVLYSPRMMKTFASLRNKTEKFVRQNPSSAQALIATRLYINDTQDLSVLRSWWDMLKGEKVKEFSTFLELKKIYKQLMPLGAGRTMSSFQAYSTDNKQEYIFAQMGKKSLMLVWSSADKYSAYLNQQLSGSIAKLSKDSVNYIAVSVDDSFDQWKTAIQNLKGKQMIVRGGLQNEDFKKTGIAQTPCIIAFGKDGKIAKVYDFGENPVK